MKKDLLYVGIGYFAFGVILMLFGIFGPSFGYESFLWGMVGGCIVPGIMMISKYIYWSRPENKEEYETKLKNEEINRNDERKVMLRDKSGRITYVISLCALFIITFVFTILKVDAFVIVTLWILLIFMYVCGVVVFNILSKKL
ncbi:hypothetical protein WS9_014625 [Paraclostridium sordellii 8483]|uniref:hypothetical protein n=1 Tax=Paraclostridium sordellii TaxID=1505 RepID=UPI000314B639|nr:hypothetical protein [Paeniclostridium sordellii]TAN64249.1 hypothetical protein WS9_014625 [Paeniclostridium sordellii 8483]